MSLSDCIYCVTNYIFFTAAIKGYKSVSLDNRIPEVVEIAFEYIQTECFSKCLLNLFLSEQK